MSAENYRSATKSHDPGWNDPPKLSYSPGVATGQTPKLNLNKRVAFPVVGSNTASQAPAVPVATASGSSLPQFIPPTSSGTPLAGPPPSANLPASPLPPKLTVGTPPRVGPIDKSGEQGEDTLAYPKDDEMREFVSSTLEDFLSKADSSRQAEIRKRLDLMQRSWSDGKLSNGLTKKIYRLALALNDGRASEANDGHRSIIVEHGKECVQWAPALRQLIQAAPKPVEVTSDVTEGDEVEAITKPL